MIEGALDHLLAELGPVLDDFSLALGTDGEVTQQRGVFALDYAQRQVFNSLHSVRPSCFARKATLTQDSSDDEVFLLPQRTFSILSVEDSDKNVWYPLYSRLRDHEVGYIAERRVSTTGLGNVPVIRFWNYQPSSSATIYAWVVEEPPRLCVSDGTFTATTGAFSSTNQYGHLVDTDDYLNGAEIGVVTGTVAGQVRTVSDYAGSTNSCTVTAWTTAPTNADDISVLTTLPRPTWRLMILEAARRILRVDKKFQDSKEDIYAELAQERQDVIVRLNKIALHGASTPRVVEEWVF